MRSSLAALRILVLPVGAINGKRIVLDGINGVIALYDENDNLVGQLDTERFRQIGATYTVELADGRVLVFSNDAGDDSVSELGPGFLTLTDSSGVTTSIEAIANRLFFAGSTGEGPVVDGTEHGYLKWSDIGNVVETWHQPNLSGTWAHAAAPNGPLEYLLRPDGWVGAYGRIANGSNTVGALLFTFPAGYRPQKTLRFPLANGGALAGGDVEVATNGEVRIRRVFGSASIEFQMEFPTY